MIPIEDLTPGKVVHLIGGSPKMTVERIEAAEPRVHVVWHHDRLGLQRDKFSAAVLTWPAPSTSRQSEPDAS